MTVINSVVLVASALLSQAAGIVTGSRNHLTTRVKEEEWRRNIQACLLCIMQTARMVGKINKKWLLFFPTSPIGNTATLPGAAYELSWWGSPPRLGGVLSLQYYPSMTFKFCIATTLFLGKHRDDTLNNK